MSGKSLPKNQRINYKIWGFTPKSFTKKVAINCTCRSFCYD